MMIKKIFALSFIAILWSQAAFGLTITNLETSQWPKVSVSVVWPNRAENSDNWYLSLANGPETQASNLTVDKPAQSDRNVLVVALDTSKSLSKDNLEAAKSALTRFSAQLDQKDQLALIAFNDTVQLASSFSSDRSNFAQAVGGLTNSGSKTEFYRALLYSFDLLKNIPGRRSLLILSDGLDEGTGVSQLDVLTSATNNKIKILSIFLSQPNSDIRHRQFMEKLASETGGRFWAVEHPDSLSMAIYDVLKDKNFLEEPEAVINLIFEIKDFEPLAEEVGATLIRKSDKTALSETLTLKIPEAMIKAPEPKPEPEPAPTPEPVQDGNWLVEKYRQQPLLLILTAISAILFIVIIVMVIKRKKRTEAQSRPTVVMPQIEGQRAAGKTIKISKSFSPFILEFSDSNRRCPLKLGRVSLGANSSNDVVINIGTVSGNHAEFMVSQTECRIKDLNSTNGTLVNGVAITQYTALKIGDVLKFGMAKAMLTNK